jgi:hypothetical protein
MFVYFFKYATQMKLHVPRRSKWLSLNAVECIKHMKAGEIVTMSDRACHQNPRKSAEAASSSEYALKTVKIAYLSITIESVIQIVNM